MASGMPGKPPPVPTVQNFGAGLKRYDLGNTQRVQNVLLVEGVDVLPGNNVDLGVPLAV